MLCKKCGAELARGAKFCGVCGRRVDGKRPCSACGQLVDEDFSFCVYCGAEMPVSKQEKVKKSKVQTQSTISSCTVDNVSGYTDENARQKSFRLIGSAFLLFGALICFVFMFFVGIAGQMAGSVEDFERLGGQLETLTGIDFSSKDRTIFYFFGDFFDDFKLLKKAELGRFDEEIIRSSLFLGITGISATILMFIGVAVFGLLAIGTYVANALQKTQKTADKWSILSICAFIFGCAVFKCLHTASIDIVSNTSMMNDLRFRGIKFPIKTVFNTTTKIALIICSVCFISYLVCKFFSVKKELLYFDKVFTVVLAIIGVAVALASICIAQNYSLMMQGSIDAKQTYSEGKIGLNFLSTNILGLQLASMIIPNLGGNDYVSFTNKVEQLYVCNLVLQVLTVFLIICLVLSVFGHAKGLDMNKNEKSGIAMPILAVIISFLLVAATIVALITANDLFDLLAEIYKWNEDNTLSYGFSMPVGLLVVLVVLSICNLAVAIGKRIMVKKCNRNDC